MKTFISVNEARALVLANVPVLDTQNLSTDDALGRTLRTAIASPEDVPRFDNSAMDGYAVLSPDVPGRLRMVEDIPAGTVPRITLHRGMCARVMTGAPIPAGADAVVPVEWTVPEEGGAVRVERAVSPQAHIRRAGRDVREGETVLEAGWLITPPMVGIMMALGCVRVSVARRPCVAVISTGDELIGAAEPLRAGKIRDSNGPALACQVASAGAVVLGPFRARDDRDSIREVIGTALEADMLLLSGGVSVGGYDLVKGVLEEMGMELLFWRVRQRPGKPLAFGVLEGKPVLGLPGNPVSSAICFEQYARPALARMLGRAEVLRPRCRAVLAAPTPKRPGLHHFVRGVAYWDEVARLQVRDSGPQGSNLYSSMVRANCIIHLDEAMEAALEGSAVEVEWLAW